MTTNFLHSLIARHQEDSVQTGAVQLVQPRPKAKFEDLSAPSPLAGNELNRTSGQEVVPVFTQEHSPSRPSPLVEPAPRQRSIEPPLLQKNFGDNVPPVNPSEQIVPLLPRRPFVETVFASQHTIEQPILQRKQIHDAVATGLNSFPPAQLGVPQQQKFFSEFAPPLPHVQHTLQPLNMQPTPPAAAKFPAFQQTPTAQKPSLERNQAVPAASPFAENLDAAHSTDCAAS